MVPFRRVLALAICLGLGAGQLAAAPSENREALFQALLKAPRDTDLMLRYARQSVAERDFEAAVSTLERLIDLDPAAVEPRYELAVAYFALGSNQMAQYHMDILQRSGALTSQETRELASYRKSAASRDARVSFSGFVEGGIALLTDRGDTGATAAFGLRHRYDLGGPTATAIITSLRGDYLDLGGSFASDYRALSLTTGPAFRLGGTRFGPVLRPYLSLRTASDDDPVDDRDMYGLGVSLDAPLSADWAAFGTVEAGRVRFDQPGSDGNYRQGQVGLSWLPTLDTLVRGSVIARDISSPNLFFDSTFRALRIDVTHSFRPGAASRDWTVSGFVQAGSEDYASLRSDDTRRVGVALRAFMTERFYVEGEAQYLDRSSSDTFFDREEPVVGIKFGMEF